MSEPSTHHEIHELRAAVGRLANRLRAQRAMEFGTTGAVIGLMAMLAAIVLYKTGWIAFAQLSNVALGAVGITLGAAIIGAIMRMDPIALAQRIDRTHGLNDRLSSALAFSRSDELDDVMRAQIEDARAYVSQVDLGLAAPFQRPTDLAPLVCFVLADRKSVV